MEISFHSHHDFDNVIPTKFCACGDSCAVVACAQFFLRSDGQQRNYGKAKFTSDLNCRQRLVGETGPGPMFVLILGHWIYCVSLGKYGQYIVWIRKALFYSHITARNPCAHLWSAQHFVMTSSNGNIFRVTGHLCGEFTGHRWIPRTKASDAELWCFRWSAPE